MNQNLPVPPLPPPPTALPVDVKQIANDAAYGWERGGFKGDMENVGELFGKSLMALLAIYTLAIFLIGVVCLCVYLVLVVVHFST